MKKSFLIISLLCINYCISQVGGNTSYGFLTIANSPRQMALGGNNVTIDNNDVNQTIINPATINETTHQKASVNFGMLYNSVNYGTAAYSHTFNNKRSFAIGISYFNYGTIEGYDAFANRTSNFSGNDMALSVGYGYPIGDTSFSIGSNVKLITSMLENYNSIAIATDIAGAYQNKENGWNIGISIRNIGTQIKSYNEVREALPFEIIMGISKRLENVPVRWHLTFDQLQKWKIAFANPNRDKTDLQGNVTKENINFFDHTLRHIIIGAELFPEKNFNIRMAYNFRKASELSIANHRHFSGLSIGLGLKYKKFKFDYAYSRQTIAGNTNMLGISYIN